jgi:hypothetical protein
MASWQFCGNFINFPHFGLLYEEKSGNPGLDESKGRRFELSIARMVEHELVE